MILYYSLLICGTCFLTSYCTKLFDFTFCKYACGYGLEDNRGHPNHHRSIKRGCLVQFLIRQLYTQPKVEEIIFYHQLHTHANGELTHGKHDLDSIAWPSFFAPWMSQAFKDHIWTQLGLGYIVKQIYDKHKAIWRARINTGVVTRDDFIR
jgi:hypothetical protein